MRGELHHVGIAVPSIDTALPFYRDVMGLVPGVPREVLGRAVRAVMLVAGGSRIELIEPLDDESGVARFLAERGRPSLHHVCFTVDDLARVLRDLADAGTELVDREPRQGLEGMVAFLHPQAADGVLIELIDRASLSEASAR